jgi:hypothetical protein
VCPDCARRTAEVQRTIGFLFFYDGVSKNV